MRFALAYFKNNIAGNTIVNEFKKLGFFPQIPIIELKKETLYSDDISKNLEFKNIDFLFFASTHRSKKGNPSLCLHTAGNWRSADLGGKPGKICPTSAYVMKYLFIKLNEIAINYELDNKYDITMEATHHGPFTEIPCCFIEIGSLEEEWRDRKAGRAIAETIISLENFDIKEIKKLYWIPSFGIGGTHYCPNFNKIQLKSKYAISHVIPKHSLPITNSIIKEAEEKTKEQIKEVLIDWKSINAEERNKIREVLDKLRLKYKRTSDVEK